MKNLDDSILNDLCDIFNADDPQGLIKIGAPPDEYASEAAMFWDRLNELSDIEVTKAVLLDIFIKQFNKKMAGTKDSYTSLATALFDYLKRNSFI